MTGIPQWVRALVLERDQWCVFCGSPRGLHVHHRRIKGIGGDKRDHANCPCNLIVLCGDCHEDAHDDRLLAEELGYIVSRETERPSEHAIRRHDGNTGVASWPDCQGGWAA